jgi:hypothetical protein
MVALVWVFVFIVFGKQPAEVVVDPAKKQA